MRRTRARRRKACRAEICKSFIVGREISLKPKVLIVSQPTWGVDVGAAAAIRQRLVDLSRSGTAVLVISEELDELFEITDRLYVMFRGRLSPPVETIQGQRRCGRSLR